MRFLAPFSLFEDEDDDIVCGVFEVSLPIGEELLLRFLATEDDDDNLWGPLLIESLLSFGVRCAFAKVVDMEDDG